MNTIFSRVLDVFYFVYYIAIESPVIMIWMVVGACIYNITELFKHLLGQSEKPYHESNVICTKKDLCAECQQANRNRIILGFGAMLVAAVLFFIVLRIVTVLGIGVILIFAALSWFVFNNEKF